MLIYLPLLFLREFVFRKWTVLLPALIFILLAVLLLELLVVNDSLDKILENCCY